MIGLALHARSEAVIEREGCADLLDKITVPVGIGVGDEDVATVPEKSERIHKAIEGSELVVFRGAGHSSSIETPDQVTELIERTIQRASNPGTETDKRPVQQSST